MSTQGVTKRCEASEAVGEHTGQEGVKPVSAVKSGSASSNSHNSKAQIGRAEEALLVWQSTHEVMRALRSTGQASSSVSHSWVALPAPDNARHTSLL